MFSIDHRLVSDKLYLQFSILIRLPLCEVEPLFVRSQGLNHSLCTVTTWTNKIFPAHKRSLSVIDSCLCVCLYRGASAGKCKSVCISCEPLLLRWVDCQLPVLCSVGEICSLIMDRLAVLVVSLLLLEGVLPASANKHNFIFHLCGNVYLAPICNDPDTYLQ